LASQSVSAVHVVAQPGVVWLAAPVQNTEVKKPQVFASTELSQALSSGTPERVAQRFISQMISPRVPWQPALSSQVVPTLPLPGQSVAVAQQAPSSQQKPLSQWALAQSVSSSQVPPLGWSGSQTPRSQCALAMQSVSSSTPALVHVVAQRSPSSAPMSQLKRPQLVAAPSTHAPSTQLPGVTSS